jgi:hypothetical protein
MLDQAVGIPQGEAKEAGHYFNFVSTAVRRLIVVLICRNSCFSMYLRSCISLVCGRFWGWISCVVREVAGVCFFLAILAYVMPG